MFKKIYEIIKNLGNYELCEGLPADVRYEEVQGVLLENAGGELAPLSPGNPVAPRCLPGFKGKPK